MTLQEAIKELEKALSETDVRPFSIKVKHGCPCQQAESVSCIPVQGLLKALLMRELLKRILLKNPEVKKRYTNDKDDTDGMYSLCISGVSGEAIEGVKTALLAFGKCLSEFSDGELDKLLDDWVVRCQEDTTLSEDNCK